MSCKCDIQQQPTKHKRQPKSNNSIFLNDTYSPICIGATGIEVAGGGGAVAVASAIGTAVASVVVTGSYIHIYIYIYIVGTIWKKDEAEKTKRIHTKQQMC